MRKLIIEEPGKVIIQQLEKPKIKDNQFLVKAIATGISAGTELTWYKGTNPGLATGRCKYPAPVGYEKIGEVIETGPEIRKIEVGDRVFIMAPHQEYTVLDENSQWYKLPEDIEAEKALFTSLTATALNAVHRANPCIGDTVCVVGMGVLGLLTGQICRLAGASEIIGIDLLDFKLETGRKVGFDHLINARETDIRKKIASLTDYEGVDIAIESSGSRNAVQTAVDSVRNKGKVLIAGFHPVPFEISGEDSYVKELDILTVRAAGGPDLNFEYTRWNHNTNTREAFRLICEGKLNLDSLITHRFKVEEIEKAYKMIDAKKENFLQVLLNW